MTYIDEAIKKEILKIFEDLKDPVTLVVFSRSDTIAVPGHDCPTCRENEILMKEVAELSERINVEIHDFLTDANKAQQNHVDKVPVTIVKGSQDPGIRLYGIPTGLEFSTLLNAIQIVSHSDSGLSPESRKRLQDLTSHIHIQVFVSPTCPYCSPAATLALRMTMESDHITADVISAHEFPELAQRYGVYTVPKVVINDTVSFEGVLPEEAFLERISNSVANSGSKEE